MAWEQPLEVDRPRHPLRPPRLFQDQIGREDFRGFADWVEKTVDLRVKMTLMRPVMKE